MKLNGWLNELVKVKPATPYAWLAARIRAGEAMGPVTSTTPALTPAASADITAPLTKAWSYCSSFRGGGAAVAPAPGGRAAGGTEVVLTIEAAGPKGVMLVIRKS